MKHGTTNQGQSARYVYCVARSGGEVSLGPIGIEDREVYAVAHNGLCAIVHDCATRSYQTGEGDVAASWVLAHHRVVDTAWKRWDAVLPITFNTIIAASTLSAEANLKAWLETEHESLKRRLDSLSGKAEYGVQVFWDPVVIARKVVEQTPEARRLEKLVASSPRGTAFMYRQKIESLLKKALEAGASEEFEDLYGRLTPCVDNIRVEKAKRAEEGRQMLMNLTCLVSRKRFPDVTAELDRVSGKEGFFIRLSGPLPPYSFC